MDVVRWTWSLMEGDVCICYISLKNKGKIKLEEMGKF